MRIRRKHIRVGFEYNHSRLHTEAELTPIKVPQQYGPEKHIDPMIATNKC